MALAGIDWLIIGGYFVLTFAIGLAGRGQAQEALVRASRAASLLLLVLAGVGAYAMQHMRIDQMWKFLMALGAGSGAVYILRWFWWRINALSEISAMTASLVYFLLVSLSGQFESLRQEYQLAIVACQPFSPGWR